MFRTMAALVGVCLSASLAQGEVDPGDCRVAGSTLQFCDPTGAACTTAKGRPGTCTQQRNGCRCVPKDGHARDRVEVCHRTGNHYHLISVSSRALFAHLAHGDCLVDDGNASTEDRCDRQDGCTHEGGGDECDDGVFCNGQEQLDPRTGDCVAVSACPPSIEGCLIHNGACDEANDRCVDVIDESLCDDGLFCNGVEQCNRATGACVAVSACPPAIDGCVIHNGACDELNDRCEDVIDENLCDDGLFCNGTEQCNPQTGDCVAVSACPPVGGCLRVTCDEANDRCNVTPDDTACDDGVFCNGAEQCEAETGECVAVSACPPSVEGCVIHNGECDEENDRCVDIVDDSLCADDGTFCNGVERCNRETGACEAVSACPISVEGCIIHNAFCDEENDRCLDLADDSLCNDGQFCNGIESCDPDLGKCVVVSTCEPSIEGCRIHNGLCEEDDDACSDVIDPDLCDDGDACTSDRCDAAAQCVHEPITPCCGNGVLEGTEECEVGILCNDDVECVNCRCIR